MAANKPTAVHFSLIFFVMATIVAGVMAYMFYNDGRELRSKVAAAEDLANKQKDDARRYSAQVNALKAKIGHQFEKIGEDAPEPNTVIYAMNQDLVKFGGKLLPPDQSSYTAALARLRQELDSVEAKLSTAQQEVTDRDGQIQTLKTSYDSQVVQHRDERTKVENARQAEEQEHQKALQSINQQLQQKINEYNQLQLVKNQADQAHQQQLADKQDEIDRLVKINNRLREDIDAANRTSFERADGLVRWVDNSSHLVWINLGSADNLTVRTNFSVYQKNNRGVGRDSDPKTLKGPEDMKGAIEVTRILEPHLAEARILDENYYNPIGVGDPIYTPIWSPNQKEWFAFVGRIDLDDDGRSDRELLHDVLAAAGAKVQVEVDDKGTRNGGAIDERTKFLVIGEIPSLDDLTDKEEKDAAVEIGKRHQELKKEARDQGVRVVTLNDFLAFIGYTPRQRVFRPGDLRPYTLRNGSRSAATSETVGKRESAGQTSGVYTRSKRLGQPVGTGQTSGGYRSGR